MTKQTQSWVQANPEDLVGSTKNAKLSHALEHGLGFLHETMPAEDQELGNSYFSSGAIQVQSYNRKACKQLGNLQAGLDTPLQGSNLISFPQGGRALHDRRACHAHTMGILQAATCAAC